MGLRLMLRLLWAVRFGDSPQGSDCASNGTNVAANELSHQIGVFPARGLSLAGRNARGERWTIDFAMAAPQASRNKAK